jgi:UMF1 family MFS transporter
VLIYILTNYGYQGGLVFYNSLMPSISTKKTIGRISGYGVALGYLGAIVGLIVARIFVDGEIFGISVPGVAAGGPTAAFIPTAILFLVFAIPVFIFVREPVIGAAESAWRVKQSYQKVLQTLKDTQKYPGLLRFLIAKLFYEDSIHTIIIFMGVYTQEVVGFTLAEANQFFIIVIPSAVVGSAFCGILVDHYGPHKTLMGVIFLWILGLVMVTLTSNRLVFWGLGCLIGALLGSTWTSARPLLITLVPRHMLGEFFGLYSLSGKVAAVIGPLVWSTVTYTFARFGNVIKYKAAIACLALIMVVGFFILRGVPDHHSQKGSAV